MMSKINILMVLNRMDFGGIEVWLMNLLRNIDRSKFHFIFYLRNKDPGYFECEIRSLGSEIIYWPLEGRYSKMQKNFKIILKEKKVNLVHSHLLLFSGFVLKYAAKLNVPIRIAHSHSSSDGKKNSFYRTFYRHLMRKYINKYATHKIGVSSEAADFCFGKNARNKNNCYIVPCAIDTQRFKQDNIRKKFCNNYGISYETRFVGHVGKFVSQKNHEFLLRIFESMVRKMDNLHLLLVGDGPDKNKIRHLANDLNILKYITFMGRRNDVPILMMNLFDILIMASRYEGLPVSIIESQCSGVPSLISDCITKEVKIIDELVEYESLKNTPEAWAVKALQILERPSYDKKRARKIIENSIFGIESNVKFFCKLYSES